MGWDNWLLIPKRKEQQGVSVPWWCPAMRLLVSADKHHHSHSDPSLDTVIPSCSHLQLIGNTQFSGKELGNNWVKNIRSESPSAPAKTQHIWFSSRSTPCVAFVCLCPIRGEMGSRWEAWVLSISKSWDYLNSHCREQRTGAKNRQSWDSSSTVRLLCFQTSDMETTPSVIRHHPNPVGMGRCKTQGGTARRKASQDSGEIHFHYLA